MRNRKCKIIYYDNFTPFNDEDIEEIKKQITLLENTEKYKLENWKQNGEIEWNLGILRNKMQTKY